jgi:hypothetical protein
MLHGKILIVGGTITTLMFAGCAKKRNDFSENHFQSSNISTTTQPAKSTTSDSEDIFNEFYKDENTSIKKEKVPSKGTFAPSASTKDCKPSQALLKMDDMSFRYQLFNHNHSQMKLRINLKQLGIMHTWQKYRIQLQH